MRVAQLDRLLSLGQSAAIHDRLARHVRVTNALALLGFLLSAVLMPLDIVGAPSQVALSDALALGLFASCWYLNARGRRLASRVTLLSTTNAVMIAGVLGIGGVPELRTVFFPLVLMPFLVLDVSERIPLGLFVALPIAAYFATGYLDVAQPGLAMEVNRLVTPVLAFLLIVAGSLVFGYIERSAEAKVLRARERATQSARLVALGEMASGIAHEIKNPLAAIHMAANQIATRSDDPVFVAELGERIQRIVMRTSRIIDGLRRFSRDAGDDPFVPTPVARIVEDACELCAKRIETRDVKLAIDPIPPELVVECRPVQLAQVLVNLLGNAFDAIATARERWIRIEIRADGDMLELAVVDSGPGVPAELRLRIFEPFYSTKAPDRGTGIGLSLSRGIAEAHHGTLELDAGAPHTRFVLRLPLRQPA